jgi:hypothetical protein
MTKAAELKRTGVFAPELPEPINHTMMNNSVNCDTQCWLMKHRQMGLQKAFAELKWGTAFTVNKQS